MGQYGANKLHNQAFFLDCRVILSGDSGYKQRFDPPALRASPLKRGTFIFLVQRSCFDHHKSSFFLGLLRVNVSILQNISNCRANLSDCRVILSSDRALICNRQAFFSERRAFWYSDRALICNSQAFFSECRANLSGDRVLICNGQAFFSDRRAFLSNC